MIDFGFFGVPGRRGAQVSELREKVEAELLSGILPFWRLSRADCE